MRHRCANRAELTLQNLTRSYRSLQNLTCFMSKDLWYIFSWPFKKRTLTLQAALLSGGGFSFRIIC